MSFATMRAVVMFGMFLGGQALGRRNDMLTSLAVALGILAAGSPFRLLDKGVLLSFGAMIGIFTSGYVTDIIFKLKKFKKLHKNKKRIVYKLTSSVISSFLVSLITAPIILSAYYQLPLYSPLINLMVIPLMTVVAVSGIGGVVVSFVSPWAGAVILQPGRVVFDLYEKVCQIFSGFPASLINTGKPEAVQIVIYYVVVLCLLIIINPRFRKLRSAVTVISLIIGLVGIATIGKLNSREQIVFLDVGQGDGILIKTKAGTNMVVDCGSASDDIGEYTMTSALLSMGMTDIDYWYISHFDKDHISGFVYILEEGYKRGISIDNIVVAKYGTENNAMRSVISIGKEKGINIIFMKPGDYIADGGCRVNCIHPSADADMDKNEGSLVLDYSSDNFKILFTGDIGASVEVSLVKRGLRAYDILKVPHHGSRFSSNEDFLCSVSPKYAVISSGINNSYGHPHSEALHRINKVGARVFRTDYNGGIYILGR